MIWFRKRSESEGEGRVLRGEGGWGSGEMSEWNCKMSEWTGIGGSGREAGKFGELSSEKRGLCTINAKMYAFSTGCVANDNYIKYLIIAHNIL
jgi:hypothetical protein